MHYLLIGLAFGVILGAAGMAWVDFNGPYWPDAPRDDRIDQTLKSRPTNSRKTPKP